MPKNTLPRQTPSPPASHYVLRKHIASEKLTPSALQSFRYYNTHFRQIQQAVICHIAQNCFEIIHIICIYLSIYRICRRFCVIHYPLPSIGHFVKKLLTFPLLKHFWFIPATTSAPKTLSSHAVHSRGDSASRFMRCPSRPLFPCSTRRFFYKKENAIPMDDVSFLARKEGFEPSEKTPIALAISLYRSFHL